jgi:hypothetical protein
MHPKLGRVVPGLEGQASPPNMTLKTKNGQQQSYSHGFVLSFPGEPTISTEVVRKAFDKFCSYYIFCHEKAGKHHYQCFLQFPSRKRWTTVLKLFQRALGCPLAMLSNKTARDDQALIFYCQDTEKPSHIAGPWSAGDYKRTDGGRPKKVSKWDDEAKLIQEHFSKVTPLGWQVGLRDHLTQPKSIDDRKIYWYWSEAGETGKTTFCRWALCCVPGTTMCGGNIRDGLYMISELPEPPNVVLFNLPRGVTSISYTLLEQLKDGFVLNTKYESGFKMMLPPKIIVFANQPPDESKLSADRWVVKRVMPVKVVA